MSKFLVFILLAFMAANAKNFCETEVEVCRYENMANEYKEKNELFPLGRSNLTTILIEVFTGEALTGRLSYLSLVPDSHLANTTLFEEQDQEVVSSKTTRTDKNTKVVKRVYAQNQKATIDGDLIDNLHAVVYTLVFKNGVWKIASIQSSAI